MIKRCGNNFYERYGYFFVASPRLSDKKPDRRRAGSEREEESPLFFSRPPAFLIIPTDRESRIGYSPSVSYKEEDIKRPCFSKFYSSEFTDTHILITL